MPEAGAPETPASDPRPSGNPAARRRLLIGLAALVALAGIVYLIVFVLLAPAREETEDAYVAGDIVSITARDPGVVLALNADNTQMVKAGQPLIELDPAAADIGLAAAEAELARAVRNFRSATSQVSGGDAGVIQAEAELGRARDDLARREKAAAEGAVSGEELTHARDAVKVADANLDLARSQQVEAESTVQGTNVMTNPAVLAAIARYRQAALTRAHMHIVAPVDGVVAQRTAQIGQQVAAGTPLMAVVPLHRVWVDANFRETQLKDIRIGQPATVTTDAYGSKTVFHGRVIGINAGSGNAFALLPPQNASGNWIKIVQRVPIRIALDPGEIDKTPLRIGLSVSVEVDTSDRSGALVGRPARQIYAEHQGNGDDPRVKARIAQIVAANRDQDR
jgi:membrane fusion protein (multidrug efflux system)